MCTFSRCANKEALIWLWKLEMWLTILRSLKRQQSPTCVSALAACSSIGKPLLPWADCEVPKLTSWLDSWQEAFVLMCRVWFPPGAVQFCRSTVSHAAMFCFVLLERKGFLLPIPLPVQTCSVYFPIVLSRTFTFSLLTEVCGVWDVALRIFVISLSIARSDLGVHLLRHLFLGRLAAILMGFSPPTSFSL